MAISSRLLLKSEIPNLSPCVRGIVDPVLVTPWQLLGEWFHMNDKATPFEMAHGVSMWDFCAQNPRFDRVCDVYKGSVLFSYFIFCQEWIRVPH